MDSDKTGREETARLGFCPLGAPLPGPLSLIFGWTSASPFLTNCQPQGTRAWVRICQAQTLYVTRCGSTPDHT